MMNRNFRSDITPDFISKVMFEIDMKMEKCIPLILYIKNDIQ